MCDEDEEDSGPEFKKMNVASGSDGTPRGHLKDRVSFFEQVWSPRSQRRLETSGDDSSFEESYERLVEEGELNGAKVVKFEKITVRKSLKEMSVAQEVRGVGACESCRTTPSDSAYQSHGHAGHQGSSKGSSVTSFGRFPSEDSLLVHSKRAASPRTPSTMEDKSSSEWYTEYNQSFHNVARMDVVRSRTEYDAHIAQIRGSSCCVKNIKVLKLNTSLK